MANSTVQLWLGNLLGSCHAESVEPLPALERPNSGVCLLVGPRQCGKSKLAEQLIGAKPCVRFDDWEPGPALQALAEQKCVYFTAQFLPGIWRRDILQQFLRQARAQQALILFECHSLPGITHELRQMIDYVFVFRDPTHTLKLHALYCNFVSRANLEQLLRQYTGRGNVLVLHNTGFPRRLYHT